MRAVLLLLSLVAVADAVSLRGADLTTLVDGGPSQPTPPNPTQDSGADKAAGALSVLVEGPGGGGSSGGGGRGGGGQTGATAPEQAPTPDAPTQSLEAVDAAAASTDGYETLHDPKDASAQVQTQALVDGGPKKAEPAKPTGDEQTNLGGGPKKKTSEDANKKALQEQALVDGGPKKAEPAKPTGSDEQTNLGGGPKKKTSEDGNKKALQEQALVDGGPKKAEPAKPTGSDDQTSLGGGPKKSDKTKKALEPVLLS